MTQVEEERDAWKLSTRQLETALMALSGRCADLEYVLSSMPGGAASTPLGSHRRARLGPRFPTQPPPDLSKHGCPKCHGSVVQLI